MAFFGECTLAVQNSGNQTHDMPQLILAGCAAAGSGTILVLFIHFLYFLLYLSVQFLFLALILISFPALVSHFISSFIFESSLPIETTCHASSTQVIDFINFPP